MTIAPATPEQHEAPLYRDGLGERVVALDQGTGELLQILRLDEGLSRVPSFEFALRERTARLASFHHPTYARVRRIDRTPARAGQLGLVSNHIVGTRLSDLLRIAHDHRLEIDISTALCVIRQLIPAIALLHEHARDVAHGLIAPERLVITPQTRLVVMEHVLSAAIEQLRYERERLWQEYRIAVPPGADPVRLVQRGDIMGIGLVALALVLGRPLQDDEGPAAVEKLLDAARERTALGYERPLSQPLRDWLVRALQMDPGREFASAREACTNFEQIVAGDSLYITAPISLEMFLSRCSAALLEPLDLSQARGFAPLEPLQSRPHQPPPDPVTPGPLASEPVPLSITGQIEAPTSKVRQEISDAAPAVLQSETIDWGPGAGQESPIAMANEIKALFSAADSPSDSETPPPSWAAVHSDVPFELPPLPPRVAWRPKLPAWNRLHVPRRAAVAGVAIALLGGGALVTRMVRTSAAAAPMAEASVIETKPGTLVVESDPAGVQILIDGVDRGRTPARLSVTPGVRQLELRGRGEPRVTTLNVAAGAEIAQHFQFARAAETGALLVESQPAGATVMIDGIHRGSAPVTVAGLTPGDHEVVLQSKAASARRLVTIAAGGTAAVNVPVGGSPAGVTATAGRPAPVVATSGWLAVKSPFPVEIRDGGRTVGAFGDDRVRMSAGRHEIQLVNSALGYRSTQVVQIAPGKVTSVTADSPQGTVHINASPWAEVWIDARRIGETPLGNIALPIGRHEVVFRHPEFGEKRKVISVTAGAPVRVSMEMK